MITELLNECGAKDVSTTEFELEGESKYLCDECYAFVKGLSALDNALS